MSASKASIHFNPGVHEYFVEAFMPCGYEVPADAKRQEIRMKEEKS